MVSSVMRAVLRRVGRARRYCPPTPTAVGPIDGAASGRDRRVVVLGADLHDVLVPGAVVRVGVALAHRVLELPRLALVGPVVGVEAVRGPPVRDRRRVV